MSTLESVRQEIRFCTAADGVRVAYATIGDGPPLVKAANWLSHLEYDLESPLWRHWLRELSRDHMLVRYDERGCGLSDPDPEDHSMNSWVRDLEAVVDAVGLERFPLLGISQGGPVAIAYAVLHPERVSHLILYGSYARGWRHRNLSPAEIEEREAMITLSRHGWGRDVPAYRDPFTRMFIPDASEEQRDWFNEMQRKTCSPEGAVRLQRALSEIQVTDLLPRVRVPTLVLHARGDLRCAFEEGRAIAAEIPGSRFVSLESRNHILLEHEPAWEHFLRELRGFLGVPTQPTRRATLPAEDAAAGPLSPPGFLRSLRRRKLGQWALAYLAAAWIALQVIGEVEQPWGLPDWFLRASQVVLGAGLPLTLVLAWYHGEKGHQRASAAEIALILALLVATGALLFLVVAR